MERNEKLADRVTAAGAGYEGRQAGQASREKNWSEMGL